MTDALITDLSKIGALKVIASLIGDALQGYGEVACGDRSGTQRGSRDRGFRPAGSGPGRVTPS